MRIYMERSGGFMGRKVRTAVDTSALPAEEAHNLHEMVDETHFFELPPVLEDGEGVDRFQYKVTVETMERRHTVETSEVAAPVELQMLLRRLTLLARTQSMRPSVPDVLDAPATPTTPPTDEPTSTASEDDAGLNEDTSET
jgi:hypothetical protein